MRLINSCLTFFMGMDVGLFWVSSLCLFLHLRKIFGIGWLPSILAGIAALYLVFLITKLLVNFGVWVYFWKPSTSRVPKFDYVSLMSEKEIQNLKKKKRSARG